MKKAILGSFITLMAFQSMAVAPKDIKVKIKTTSDLEAVGHATYIAKSESFFCKELVFNEGSPKRVPKRMYGEFSSSNQVLTIPGKIDTKCNYDRLEDASIGFERPGRAEPANVISLLYSGTIKNSKKEIKCSEVLYGRNMDELMIRCSSPGPTYVGKDGKVTLNVTMK